METKKRKRRHTRTESKAFKEVKIDDIVLKFKTKKEIKKEQDDRWEKDKKEIEEKRLTKFTDDTFKKINEKYNDSDSDFSEDEETEGEKISWRFRNMVRRVNSENDLKPLNRNY
jgi:hypothetical protein